MSTEMWALFEQYQTYADKKDHGESWKQMTNERTQESMVNAAAVITWKAAAWEATAAAWWATEAAAWDAAADAAKCEAKAIKHITNAIKEAQL